MTTTEWTRTDYLDHDLRSLVLTIARALTDCSDATVSRDAANLLRRAR